MHKVKWIFIAVILSVLLGCEQASNNQLENIKHKQVIRVGTLAGPGNYFQARHGEQGFEYELSAEFADFLGVQLQMVPFFSLSELFARLNSGDLDMIASGISYHPQRIKHYRFGPSYRTISQKLVYKQGRARPRSMEDIEKPITVLANSSHVLTLQQLEQKHPTLKWHTVSDMDEEELLLGIIDEQIDYTITDSHTLALFRRYHPTVSIGFSVTRGDPISWILRNNGDDSLYALLLPFFAELKQTDVLYTLEEKYYGHVASFNYVNALAFVESAHEVLPNYLAWFKAHAKNIDWRLLAALSYQESMWDPRAKSPTGVRGIMMLTRPTAKQVGVTNRLEPEQNIRGGAQYLAKLLKRIPKRIPQPDRTWFALASYNVGWGHVNDARIITQRQGADPDSWADVKKRLPLLIKKRYYRNTKYGYARGDVAVQYVDNIRRYYDALVWLDENDALSAHSSK
ncbi:Membrane-bound lytic murein transglycosylase F [Pseudoalteromonas holothuriae]|uniref:Membrane-bound lytic murein transglycosylase F n=1 Tax=Pseudoalteromonas holothuriae TaxID=2963714 RepID=A0A9W4VRC5_9GAMM|nr:MULTISPECIES: membrane-bound lytic murein transglycosylase MltF [unclassified Pseudoalteromonas]CAH9059239.1 Membrane-bound lytic murein transglycosylase F [Pseudoalteromonas sp. CIP111854]CAH9067813.1 Membrane-bound lytic murein transglycosylase F [Pseudoalteromonas sp. CIP111951]